MKPVRLMVGASVMSWIVAMALLGTRTGLDVLFGMIGPLVIASSTWVLAERTYRRNPERLMSLMIKAFAVKMVFFGAYVAVVLGVLSVRPVPFVVSFTSYFIALHAMEAFCLRRLLAETRATR